MARNRDELNWGILAGSIGPRVRLLRNALTARSITVSAPQGLPTGSLTVLALIAGNSASSQSALAIKAGLNKSALVGIVDQLEQRGLAVRDRSDADRRRNVMRLTAEGEMAMTGLFAAVTREESAIREALGARDLAQFLNLLDQAIAALE
ncbi:MAG: MarR family winged helix-turn-helix transcriptional regulator [Croceibacterium sp.]